RDVLTVTYGHPDGRRAARTVGSGDAVLYLDDRGDAIRVEIIRAGQRHPPEFLHSLDGHADSIPLATAAEQFGVKAYALREEILSGGMPATRAEQSWRISRGALEVYREILAVRQAADRH